MANTQSSGGIQIQQTINKQLVTLRQDQNISNSIMCKVLAELENLVFFCGYNGKTYFNYYATKGQTKKEMINQIVYQMTIFSSSYKNFIRHNPKKKYEFPNNYTYENIIALITNWKNFIKKDKSNSSLEKYYDSFLRILEGKNLDKYILDEFTNIDKDAKPTTKEDLKRALNAGAISTTIINDKNKEIEKNIIEKGDYKVNVVIGGKREDNKFYKQFEKNDEIFKKEKKKLFKLFYSAIGYLELYYKINSDDKIENKFKYYYNIKNELKNDFLQKYEKYKEEFIQKNIDIYKDYQYDVFKDKNVKKVEAELENWKNFIIKNNKLEKEIDNAIKVLCKGEENSKEYK